MINLKMAGAAALLAIAPLVMTTSADARPGVGRGGGGAVHVGGGGFRGGAASFTARGGGANFAAAGGNVRSVVPSGAAMAPNVAPSMAYNRGGGGRHWDGRRWIGPGLGFVAGVAAGAALASPGYYDNGYYADGYGYTNGDYGDSYAYDNGPDVTYGNDAPAGDDAVAYCQQTYRSYDPASGTYLGYDGLRHPCP